MKICPYCKEEIKGDAIKCRYCQTLLVSVPQTEDPAHATYIVDRDLIRFAKFSSAVLSVLVVVGLVLFGVDLNHMRDKMTEALDKMDKSLQANKDYAAQARETMEKSLAASKDYAAQAKETLDRTNKLAKDMESSSVVIEADKERTKAYAAQAKDTLDKTNKLASTTEAVFAEIEANKEKASASVARITLLEVNLSNALSGKQKSDEVLNAAVASLSPDNQGHADPAAKSYHLYTESEIVDLMTKDIRRLTAFYTSLGLKLPSIPTRIHPEPDYTNIYWDGTALLFGMGMVNSSFFGPYDSRLIFHEATHSLIRLTFSGQSGAVNESICDVMAVLAEGGDWNLGYVKSGDPAKPMYIRSLQNPGTAYNTPDIGRDPQPSHMDDYVTTDNDNGGVHINEGIVNKAAYLMSEGGTFHGVAIGQGIGHPKLASLYSRVIQSLPAGDLNFQQFRKLVAAAAEAEFGKGSEEVRVVQKSFDAVGIS